MASGRDINEKSLELIKNSEGWRSCGYKDPIGKLTIGYGHLIKPGDGFTATSCLTKDVGTELLRADVLSAAKCVDKIVEVPLNDNERGALVSWTYNVGCNNAQSSTLIKELNSGNKDAVCGELKRWTKADGKELPGLVTRRQNECDLFKMCNSAPETNVKNIFEDVFGPTPSRPGPNQDMLRLFNE